jgi:sec-independent protein translocase protein TatA
MNLAMWTPGPLEIVIILVIVLIIFGPKRLPDLGRSLGHGMREFKDSVTGKDKDELPPSSAGTPEREPKPEPEREPATTASEQKS